MSWNDVPTMPVEMILLPRWFPIHLSKMSYWARTVIVPLLVLQALKPLARNPRGVHVPRTVRGQRRISQLPARADTRTGYWAAFFNALDVVLKAVEPVWPKGLRKRAIDRCVAFVDRAAERRGRPGRHLSRPWPTA